MRNISFSMTTPQFIAGEKDVTRRFGWWNLKPGDRLRAVEKAMGLKKGEKMVSLGEIEIVSARAEPLNRMALEPEYGAEEMRREGFPFGLRDPAEFVRRMTPPGRGQDCMVNRIEFIKVMPSGDKLG